jgi:hypothetical protein
MYLTPPAPPPPAGLELDAPPPPPTIKTSNPGTAGGIVNVPLLVNIVAAALLLFPKALVVTDNNELSLPILILFVL